MAEEQSSLRQAIDKIMGWPAGGGQQGATGGGTAGGEASPGFAPSAPALSGAVNLGTTSALSNLVPEAVADPFEAQLAEIRAQNAALSASLTPVAATIPTGGGGLTYEQQLRNDLAFSGLTPKTTNDIVALDLFNKGYTSSTLYDPAAMALNKDIQQGQAKVTTSGPYDPTKVTYQSAGWALPTSGRV